jgi:hypothetical protein
MKHNCALYLPCPRDLGDDNVLPKHGENLARIAQTRNDQHFFGVLHRRLLNYRLDVNKTMPLVAAVPNILEKAHKLIRRQIR